MGAVWVAEDLRLRTEVALKFVLPQVNGAEIVERFRREAHIVAQIRSPNVVQIIDVGIDELGRDYLVMELLVGEDFGSLLSRRERISLQEAVPIILQAARGLARAHAQGVVHRDIKPDNLFLCSDEMGMTVKVLDFGIAKGGANMAQSNLTSMGTIIGTPDYMTPEQVMNEGPCTAATDLYALAAVLYRSITGVVPFVGKSMTEQLVRITTDPLRPASSLVPELPASLDAWFETALAKAPSARPASAKHFVDALLVATSDGMSTGRMSTPSWSDGLRPTSGGTLVMNAPATSAAPVLTAAKPTTTKSITLDNLRADDVKIPVSSRAGLFVAAGVGGLVLAAGVVFALRGLRAEATAALVAATTTAASAATGTSTPTAPAASVSLPGLATPTPDASIAPAITPSPSAKEPAKPPPPPGAKGKTPPTPPKTSKTTKTNDPDFY
jgi:serine/threonine-protein kinase